MTKIICMDLLAEDQGIALTTEEKARIKDAAAKYYESFNVNAGFNGDCASGDKNICGTRACIGTFVDFKTEPVAEAVTEALAVTVRCDDIPRCLVKIGGVHIGTKHFKALELSFKNNVVNLHELIAGFADCECAGHIRTITVYACAKVHNNEITVLNLARTGIRMAKRTVGTGTDDGVE